MNNPNDGGPAFPHLHNSCQRINETEMFPGMSLRDYFAGQAMQGILAGSLLLKIGDVCARKGASEEVFLPAVAALAYHTADAMLAAKGGAS